MNGVNNKIVIISMIYPDSLYRTGGKKGFCLRLGAEEHWRRYAASRAFSAKIGWVTEARMQLSLDSRQFCIIICLNLQEGAV